jgi:hypothetical protein
LSFCIAAPKPTPYPTNVLTYKPTPKPTPQSPYKPSYYSTPEATAKEVSSKGKGGKGGHSDDYYGNSKVSSLHLGHESCLIAFFLIRFSFCSFRVGIHPKVVAMVKVCAAAQVTTRVARAI